MTAEKGNKKIFEFPDDVKLIEEFLPSNECKDLIVSSEQKGFDEAAVNTGNGQEIFKAIRNNDRILFDDHLLAEKLFVLIKDYVPKVIEGWNLYGLNERFRFYRYEKDQYFKWHRDGAFRRNGNEESKITFMVYLNDDFSGGSTDFRGFKVMPKTGAALVFPHRAMHQGRNVDEGTKYVLRTDVMYEIS